MNRILSALLVVAALAVPAIAAADVHVYTRVNQVAIDHSDVWTDPHSALEISGVRPDGEHSFSYRFNHRPEDRPSRTSESCERYASMAMAKPGRYALEVRFEPVSETYGRLTGCTLRRIDQEPRQ